MDPYAASHNYAGHHYTGHYYSLWIRTQRARRCGHQDRTPAKNIYICILAFVIVTLVFVIVTRMAFCHRAILVFVIVTHMAFCHRDTLVLVIVTYWCLSS